MSTCLLPANPALLTEWAREPRPLQEDDEHFRLLLSEAVGGETALGAPPTCGVTIINDDFPGTFVLPIEDVKVPRGAAPSVELTVQRVNGSSGEVHALAASRRGCPDRSGT